MGAFFAGKRIITPWVRPWGYPVRKKNVQSSWLQFSGSGDRLFFDGFACSLQTIEILLDAGDIANSNSKGSALSFRDMQCELCLGEVSGYAENETITLQTAFGDYQRTYVRENFPSGAHLISCRWNGLTYDIFVNGEKKTAYQGSDGSVPLISSTFLKLGEGGRDGYLPFQGNIAEVRIWSESRTDLEILEGCGKTLTGKERGLAAYFPLLEGEGTLTKELISGQDVIIEGATWVTNR
jgi:hypothetical protein